MRRLTLLLLLTGACNQALDVATPGDGGFVFPPVGIPGAAQPTRERCNGVDDDLDGRIDEGCPIRLTNNPRDDIMPSLDHGRVAWIRLPQTTTSSYNEGDLYVRDLPNGEERLVAHSATWPSLSGDRVAYWTPSRLSYGVVDLDTGEETLIPFTGFDHGRPWLSGTTMVYQQYDAIDSDPWQENYNVYIWHVGDKLPAALVVDVDGQREPVLDGNKIFFSDDRDGHHVISLSHLFELWTFDLSSGAEDRLWQRPADGSLGMIEAHDQGRSLAYQMGGFYTDGPPPFPAVVASTCQLMLFDAAGVSTPLDESTDYDSSACPLLAWTPDNAALNGDVVVHELDPGGTSDLELIDLSTMQRVQVTDYPRRSTQPRLDGRYLVWQDDRHDDWELYYIDLIDRAQGDLYPEGRSP
jgi:hypothetical protein